MRQISHLDLTIWQSWLTIFFLIFPFDPPETLENLGFLMFSGGSKESIGKKRVKHMDKVVE